jgi:hypothetical protein
MLPDVTRRTDDTVRGHTADNLFLLGHAPVLGGSGRRPGTTDGLLKRHTSARSGEWMSQADPSGRPPPSIAYSQRMEASVTGSRNDLKAEIAATTVALTKWPSHGRFHVSALPGAASSQPAVSALHTIAMPKSDCFSSDLMTCQNLTCWCNSLNA